MPEWDAEVAIDEPLVRALVAEQFPELDASSARLLGEGWDNSVWVVEDRLAFRFPRRQIAIPGVERELAVLPRLAPLVPAPIPEPRFIGVPSARFPWPFFGAPLLSGVEPCDAGLVDDEQREALGGELGHFLSVLHSSETLSLADPSVTLPDDPIRRADTPFRVTRTRERIAELPPGLWQPPAGVEAILAEGERLPPSTRRVLTHGDLHIRHLLVTARALRGVIDWGDMCRSDPAIDLMLVWLLLPPAGRQRFVEAYGPIDDEASLRARVLALFLGLTLAVYARDTGHAALERECVARLERTLVD
jgi:aminoglycoside phosphotransferase (APT) family kinase protein